MRKLFVCLFVLLPFAGWAQFKFKTAEGMWIEVKNSPQTVFPTFENYFVCRGDTLEAYTVSHENRVISSVLVGTYLLSDTLFKTMPTRFEDGSVAIIFTRAIKIRYYTATTTLDKMPETDGFSDITAGEYMYSFPRRFYERTIYRQLYEALPASKQVEAKKKYAYNNLPDSKIDFEK